MFTKSSNVFLNSDIIKLLHGIITLIFIVLSGVCFSVFQIELVEIWRRCICRTIYMYIYDRSTNFVKHRGKINI